VKIFSFGTAQQQPVSDMEWRFIAALSGEIHFAVFGKWNRTSFY
jgi:hypothetical protein